MRRMLANAGLALLVAAHPAIAQQGGVGGSGGLGGRGGLTIDWARTSVNGAAAARGEGPDGATALKIQGRATGTLLHLVTIPRPPVTVPRYVVTGEVRYQGVEGQAYFEMWSAFPDGERYFSRTLDAGGMLAALHGDSKWRRFALPFVYNATAGTAPLPSRLEINFVLPGRGTVWIGPMRLQRFGLPPVATTGGWWNERVGSLAGVLGSVLGLVGGLVGVLAGLGKARRLALSLVVGMVLVGVGLAALGAVATLSSQPRYVWYPLLLVGGVSALVGLVVLPVVRRRYAELTRAQPIGG
ncbi:MAG TPA: hypothetical protein VM716_01650 [Gemmatimonadales bacterium]|nr:hypothetical protein [Gemmatimonadales bacterium]